MNDTSKTNSPNSRDTWQCAGRTFHSRLLVGTGKYKDLAKAKAAISASGAEIVTFALRRLAPAKGAQQGTSSGTSNLLDILPKETYTYLPNTAGCYTAEDAVRCAYMAEELLDGCKRVKLEVLGNETTLYPNMPDTLKAAKTLVERGFEVWCYTNDDPVAARRLADIGCAAIMPLAAPIGSGLGVCNPHTIQIILNEATTPILVDAGVGCASDAAIAMELGCDAILMNTAIAKAKNPVLMAKAMQAAVIAGRYSYRAGRMAKQSFGAPSSPTEHNAFAKVN